MTSRERRTLTSLQEVYRSSTRSIPNLLSDLPPQFGVTAEQLGGVLARIDDIVIGRYSNSPFTNACIRRNLLLTRLLSEYLQPMRQIARRSGIAPDTPEGAGDAEPAVSFVVPRPRTALTTILERARTYANAARPHRETFVTLGMNAKFIEELEVLIETIASEAGSASDARTRDVQEGREFRALLKEGRQIAWILDAILRRHCARIVNTRTDKTSSSRLAGVDTALADWDKSFHIRADPVRQARRLEPML